MATCRDTGAHERTVFCSPARHCSEIPYYSTDSEIKSSRLSRLSGTDAVSISAERSRQLSGRGDVPFTELRDGRRHGRCLRTRGGLHTFLAL